jgi:hypothetical protein
MARSIEQLELIDGRITLVCVSADEMRMLVKAGAEIIEKTQTPNGTCTDMTVRFCRTINRRYSWSDPSKDKPGQPAQALGLTS